MPLERFYWFTVPEGASVYRFALEVNGALVDGEIVERREAAAAGMGKVDEALRIERKVASGDGEEGPDDPRRVARLHSAVRLAGLLLKARKENNQTLTICSQHS